MSLTPTRKRGTQLLSTPLETIRGVGPRVLEKLAKLGLHTVEDALYCLPFRYEDRRQLKTIAQLLPGTDQVFAGEITYAAETVTPRARKKIFEAEIGRAHV